MQWIALFALLLTLILPARASETPTRTIYRCESPTGIAFSDRPCGPASQPYEAGRGSVSVMTTVVPPATAAPKAAAVPRQSSGTKDSAKRDTCDRIEQSLRKITSTMRSGYSAKQGERLRERKRELEDKRRTQRC